MLSDATSSVVVGTKASAIPFFVINMDSASGRWGRISKHLGDFGLVFERLSAVNGSIISPADILGLCPPSTWLGKRPLTAGELGCFLSHRKALQIVLDRGLEHAVIMEDDVLFDADFPKFLTHVHSMPAFAHVLKFEVAMPKPLLRGVHVGRLANRDLVFFPEGGEGGSACYLVTREGARKLLEDLAVVRNTYDGQAFRSWRNGVVTLHVVPLPAVQTGQSEIERPSSVSKKKRRKASKLARKYREIQRNTRSMRFQLKTFGWAALRKRSYRFDLHQN